MRTLLVPCALLAFAALSASCGDDDGDKLACEGTGTCMTAAQCEDLAQTPVNPSAYDYDCPGEQICCVLIDGGGTDTGPGPDAGDDAGIDGGDGGI